MAFRLFTFLVLLFGCACAGPINQVIESEAADTAPQEKEDLKAASSSYVRRSDWGAGYPSGYSVSTVTGYGAVDDRYNSYNGAGIGGYDNAYGYDGYSRGYPNYSGVSGYGGYNRGYGGATGYGGSGGYGVTGYGGYGGGSGGYGAGGYSGNGGYGGYGGNGGLNSYYGYSNPYNQGAYHLGYGYYNKGPRYGNIYNNGITPSLVTGYRGYSRR